MLKIWLIFLLFGKTVASIGPMPGGDCEAQRLVYEAELNLGFSTLPANDPALQYQGKLVTRGDAAFACWVGKEPPVLDEGASQ
jgi:hypothetical protein